MTIQKITHGFQAPGIVFVVSAYTRPTYRRARTVPITNATEADVDKYSPIGVQISGGNKNVHMSGQDDVSDAIQLFLRKKTMDSTQPTLTTFSRKNAQQSMTVAPTSGQEVNRFAWLVYRPQAHAIRPFESDHSARQEKIVNTDPNKLR